MVCDEFHSDATAIFKHECTGKSRANEQRARAFVGLKRGKDWQQCPNRACARRVELSEACNHMTCPCGTGFCFICGKEADGGDDHWTRRGGCPRYNQPDDDNAEYDDASDYDEDEVEDDHAVQLERERNRLNGDPVEEIRGLFEDEINAEAPAENNNVALPAPPPPPPPPLPPLALLRTMMAPMPTLQTAGIPAPPLPAQALSHEALLQRLERRASVGDSPGSARTLPQPGFQFISGLEAGFTESVDNTFAATRNAVLNAIHNEDMGSASLPITSADERPEVSAREEMTATQPESTLQEMTETRSGPWHGLTLRRPYLDSDRRAGVVFPSPGLEVMLARADSGSALLAEADGILDNGPVRRDSQTDAESDDAVVEVGGMQVTMEEMNDDEMIWQIRSSDA